MPIIDVILLILLFGFIFYGLFFGFIRTIGVLIGIVVGALLASHFYLYVSELVNYFFFGYNNLGKVLIFIILFSIISKLVSFLFSLLSSGLKIFSIIPFFKTFNRIAGALFGFIAGSLVIGLILYVSSRYAFIDHWFGKWLVDSKLSPMFLKFNNLLLPLLPDILKKLKSLI